MPEEQCLQLQLPGIRLPAQQLQPMDGDVAGRQVHHLTAAGAAVGPLSIDMNRRHLGWCLLNRASERIKALVQVAAGQLRPGLTLQHVPVEVVAAGAQA